MCGLLSSGCGRDPVTFPMPPQQTADLGEDPGGLGPWITMDDPTAGEYIVRDISGARDHHRWAFAHPEMRFRVKESGYSKFAAEFAIPEVTFKETGPVRIAAAVDGHPLEEFVCDHAGDYRMVKPLPAELPKGKEVKVTFDAQPRWVSPQDGAQLSFYLRAAGFVR